MIFIDISRPPSDFLAKKRKGGKAGLWQSIALLLLALGIATIVGVAGVWVLQLFTPQVPVYVGLVFGLLALVLVLQYIAQRFEWIMPWYYLLPALIFLFTFTVFPVVLTIFLAFTDYAGIRNGELSVSTETAIVAVDGQQLTIDNARTLNCDALQGSRKGCNNVRAVVYASGRFATQGISLEDNILTVEPAPPAGRNVTAVELLLPDFGFRAQIPVTAVEGNRLTLGRSPPGEISLEDISLTLDRISIERRILSLEDNTLTINVPLPTDLEYVAIARYNDFGYIGAANFNTIIRQANRALWPVFRWNIIFAVSTIIINTIIGVFIAVLLNNPNLRFRNLYRTLLIVPWALPAIITIQVWRGFLNTNFGAINRVLALLDLPTLNWLGDPLYAKLAVLLVNLWLGLPFVMTATLGALSAIPKDIYEAVKIDGASAWQSFWGVTAPLLRTALIPITLTGFAFNFNNFNIIFLLTDGGPPVDWGTATARGTDILISWAYNESFRAQGGYAYGLGSAISILIFIITLGVSLVNFRVTGALKEESNT